MTLKSKQAVFFQLIIEACLLFAPARPLSAMDAGRRTPPRVILAKVQWGVPRQSVPQSFLGFSIEWGLIDHLTTGKYHRRQAMIHLINMLEKYNGPMVLRIGGNSEDEAAYRLPQDHGLPKFVHINITRRSLERLAALSRATNCKYIIGLNLGTNQPALAVRLVRAAEHVIGKKRILAFEIGNEIDSLGRLGGLWKHNTFASCMRRWRRYDRAIRPYLKNPNDVAGPAFSGNWNRDIPAFIRAEHGRICIVTLHRYPLGAPIKNPKSPAFASIRHLLGNRAARAFGPGLMGSTIAVASAYGLPVRWGEMNSVWGGGKKGVSSTFAAALWCADALFEAANAGAAGVNVHMSEAFDGFPGAYDPVYFHPHGALEVRPSFYGVLLFAQAIGDDARIVPVQYQTHVNVKIWATRAAGGCRRVVVINKSLHRRVMIKVRLGVAGRVGIMKLTAPSVLAVRHVTYGGRSFYRSVRGKLRGAMEITNVDNTNGTISVLVMPASAVLISCAK